ncbi:hypothetical protein GIB67_021599 [Kingdonia uniflora]|uniref:Uncharacterized protein n=1 Tax=Kingdonia uniflora TaxID=39325 RepID=A0A7J7ME04_9MAGN|nr:hypothetical protein GIB67_021599 [Kingdonia uniflora]
MPGYENIVISNELNVEKGNIWIFWLKGTPAPGVISMNKQYITVLYMESCFSFVHADCSRINRLELWDDLSNFTATNIKPLICIGDFNVVLQVAEKRGRHPPNTNAVIHSSGLTFMWFNAQSGNNRMLVVLYRCLQNVVWQSTFRGWRMKVQPRTQSDHSLIIGECYQVPKPTNIPFRYLQSWRKEPKFGDIVASSRGKPMNEDKFFRTAYYGGHADMYKPYEDDQKIIKHKGPAKNYVNADWFNSQYIKPSTTQNICIESNFRIDWENLNIGKRLTQLTLRLEMGNKRDLVFYENNLWIDTVPKEVLDLAGEETTVQKIDLQIVEDELEKKKKELAKKDLEYSKYMATLDQEIITLREKIQSLEDANPHEVKTMSSHQNKNKDSKKDKKKGSKKDNKNGSKKDKKNGSNPAPTHPTS